MVQEQQEQTPGSSHLEQALHDPDKRRLAEAVMEEARRSPNHLRKNYSGMSGISLEYSIDSAGNTIGESTVGSSLLGQNIDTGTVASISTKNPRGQNGVAHDVVREGSASAEESHESSFLSTQDSDEPVPADEELFKFGWAKALDPNSGSYYYFTLDRSKIVWENPLAPPSQSTDDDSSIGDDLDDDDDEDIPESAAHI